MSRRIIQRGAEALIYLSERGLIKDRVKKSYRIPVLDKRIRKQRTKREASLIEKTRRAGVSVPRVLEIKESSLEMEYIDGKRIKDIFNQVSDQERTRIAEEIGIAVSKLHSADIIHGDLTTSNMILKKGKIYFIDFGLGKISKKSEDKATDLYLLLQALKSTHFVVWKQTWGTILNIYKKHYHKSNEILKRFEKIEKRRRYS